MDHRDGHPRRIERQPSALEVVSDQWIDCGIFLDQLMLLAREKGLHTCTQAAFSRYQRVVRRELDIGDEQVVICGLALGYADEEETPNNLLTERVPIGDFTHWYVA